ncbi:hypothetical protein NCAS_0I02890 [Naumovozyma castellii]|uniref:Uncharacterized protein n=1 Tax=Naumovozyma castellii TaxID=27288 RepID=G0VKC3_NAUCA|nr:hypothetical protein NCAS_0I02890 [Naumovozyma castellii CBS 4309]CCC71957.1 hypothetical protein NCAS_0I02890 [Naumovozyma castellii CBS 4309]
MSISTLSDQSTLTQNDDELSDDTSNNKYLMAPFDEEHSQFLCECVSCCKSREYKRWFVRNFWVGIIFPPLWVLNVGSYIYFQFWLSHDVVHRKLEEEEFPSAFERKQWIQRHQLEVPGATVDEMNQLANEETIPEVSVQKEASEDDDYSLKIHRYQFLKNVVEEIVDSHDNVRSFYRTWLLRDVGGIVMYTVILVVVLVLCVHNSSAK